MNLRKIAFIAGDFGPLSPEMNRRLNILQSAASSGTQIDMYGGKGSIGSRKGEYMGTGKFDAIESEYGLAYLFPHEAKVCHEAEQDGYDAIILACGGDPGLYGVFEAVSIPVIGPGTTARHICSLISHRFTLLTTGKHGAVYNMMEHERPHNLGRWVSTRTIGLSVLDVRERPKEAYEAMLSEAKAAMANEGSDAFTYGCMSMSFLDVDKKLEAELGVPFINPGKTAVKVAEVFIDLGITHSKVTFPKPDNYMFK